MGRRSRGVGSGAAGDGIWGLEIEGGRARFRCGRREVEVRFWAERAVVKSAGIGAVRREETMEVCTVWRKCRMSGMGVSDMNPCGREKLVEEG